MDGYVEMAMTYVVAGGGWDMAFLRRLAISLGSNLIDAISTRYLITTP